MIQVLRLAMALATLLSASCQSTLSDESVFRAESPGETHNQGLELVRQASRSVDRFEDEIKSQEKLNKEFLDQLRQLESQTTKLSRQISSLLSDDEMDQLLKRQAGMLVGELERIQESVSELNDNAARLIDGQVSREALGRQLHSQKQLILEELNQAEKRLTRLLEEDWVPANQCATPIIFAVGNTQILTFSDRPEEQRDIRITIEGQGLSKDCTHLWVQVGETRIGEWPIDFTLDYLNGEKGQPRNQLPYVTLHKNFLAHAKTGDRVRLLVRAKARYREPDKKGESSTEAATHVFERSFTLYTVEDYRKLIQDRHLRTANFSATPASYEETYRLFGRWVADHYFAIRLTMFNESDQAKLVSISRIKAHGRVMVRPIKDVGYPTFTIPIDISPQPATHMYSALESVEPKSARSIWFRVFQLAGTLGSLYGSVYANSPNPTEAWGLWSSEVVPALGKLWPDPWPAFKANVVSKTMPDLVRIPENSSNDNAGQYIFFSKDKIEGLLNDQKLFTDAIWYKNLWSILRAKGEAPPRPPDMNVLSIDFESLLIPYEVTSSPTELTMARLITQAKVDVLGILADLSAFKANPAFYGHIDLTELKLARGSFSIGDLVGSLQDFAKANLEDDEKTASLFTLETFSGRLEQLRDFKTELVDHSQLGIEAFEEVKIEISLIENNQLAGIDTSMNRERLKSIESQVEEFRKALHFYGLLAASVRELIVKVTGSDGSLVEIQADRYKMLIDKITTYNAVLKDAESRLVDENPA